MCNHVYFLISSLISNETVAIIKFKLQKQFNVEDHKHLIFCQENCVYTVSPETCYCHLPTGCPQSHLKPVIATYLLCVI